MSTPEPQQLGSGGSGGDGQEVDMDTREDQAPKGSSARAGPETISEGKTLEAQEEDAVKEGRGTEDKELRTQAPQPAESSSELRRSSRAVARPDYIGMDNGNEGESQESQGYVPTRSQSCRAAMTDGNEIAAPSEAVLERPRRGERVNYENYFESQELIEDGNEEERVGAKKRVGEEPAQNEETPKRKRGRPKNKPLPDPGQDPEGAAAPTSAEPSTPAVVEPEQVTEFEPEDLMQGPPPVTTEPSTSSAGQPGDSEKERARKRKDNGEGDGKPIKVSKSRSKPRQKKEGEEGNDEELMEVDAEDSMEGPPPVSTEPSTSSAGQPGVSVKERARKRKKEKDPDWKMRRNPKSRSKPRQKKEGEEGIDEEPMDVHDEDKKSEDEQVEEPPKSRRRGSAVSKPRNKKKDGDDVNENGPSSPPTIDRTFFIYMPNAFAHTKKLEELKTFFFNIQRYQLRRLMEDTERDEEWLEKVLAYTNCIRAQFTYTHTWAACYALMLSPWGLDEETKKRILEKENDKKKCKKFLITPPLVSIPGIPELLQKDLWMLPATHHLHSIKEDQKDKGWIDKAARMMVLVFMKFSTEIKDLDEFGEAFLSKMLNFDMEVSRKILDSVKLLLLKDIVEKESRIQDAENPLHQMVAKLLVDKNTPSTSSAPPSRPEPPHSAGSLGLSTGPSTSSDPSGSSSPHHSGQSPNQQPPSDDKDAPQQDNETQTEQNTEWRGLIKKFRENMKDFEWAQEYQVYPSPFPHEVVLNMEEWETLGQLKDRGKKEVEKKQKVVKEKVVKEKVVKKKVMSKEGKGEVVKLCGVPVQFTGGSDDEQGELGLKRIRPEDSGGDGMDATVPVRCVERMIESVVIRPGVPVKDDEDDLQEDDQDQQPAQHVNRNLEMKKLRRGWVTRRQKAAQQSSGIQAATQNPELQASNASEDLQQQQELVANGQDAAPQHQSDPRAPQEGQQELTTPVGDDPEKPAKVQAIYEDIRREAMPFLPAEVRLVERDEGADDHRREEVRPMRNEEDHQMEEQVVRPVEDEVIPQEEARPDQDMEVDHQEQAAAWDVEDFQIQDVRPVEEVEAGGQGDDEVPGFKQIFNLDTKTVVTVKDVIPGTLRNVATSPMRFDDSPETQQPSTSIIQEAPDAEIVKESVNSGVEVDELEFIDDNSASSVPRNDFEKDLRVEEAPETSTTSLVNNQSSSKKIFSHESVNVKIGKLNPRGHALLRALLDESPDALEIIPFAQNAEAIDVGAASSSQNNAPKDASIQEDHVVTVTEPQEAPGEGNEPEPIDTKESAANSTEHSAEDEVMAVQNEANPQIEEPLVQENDQSFHAPHETDIIAESVSTSPETSTRKDRDDQMDVDNAPEIEDDVGAASSSPTTFSKDASIQEEKKAVQEEIVEPEPMDTQETTENSNGVVQETSSEPLVPPIEAEKDPDQTPMEIDSLPEGSLSRNESGSVPRNTPGKASKSSTRTPTTPVTENLAPMLRCEHSAVDEAIVVRSDKKKTNGQEKEGSEKLSTAMNEENETAETSNPPKVAVDQLGSKPVDGEDPDEISPEMSDDQDNQMENEVQEKPDEDKSPISSHSEPLTSYSSQTPSNSSFRSEDAHETSPDPVVPTPSNEDPQPTAEVRNEEEKQAVQETDEPSLETPMEIDGLPIDDQNEPATEASRTVQGSSSSEFVRNASEVAMETEDHDPRNETTENSNGVVQETSSEHLLPPIEAEKDPDQPLIDAVIPIEVDSLPEGSLSQNESGSVPRNAPGKACKSSTRTPTTPVTDNLAPMLRCEQSTVDEVRSDKKKTNGQEKKRSEELSAVMNEENETAETSTPPKVAVDQLGSKPVDREDPDEISPEMGKHVNPSADVRKDQSSPKTPDDAQNSSTANSVVPTSDSSAEENIQSLPKSNDEDHQMENEDESHFKALPNPSSGSEESMEVYHRDALDGPPPEEPVAESTVDNKDEEPLNHLTDTAEDDQRMDEEKNEQLNMGTGLNQEVQRTNEGKSPVPSRSETLKEDQSHDNTLPDSSSCSKISATGSENGSGAENLSLRNEPEIVEPFVDLVESLSLPSSSNRSEEAMEDAGLKDTLDGEELEKDQDLEDDGDQKEAEDPRNANASQLTSDACSSSTTTLPEDSFDSNITDQGDLESMSREDDQEESEVDELQSGNLPSSSSTSEPMDGMPPHTTNNLVENVQEGDIEAQKSSEALQEAGPSTSSPRARQEDQISHGAALDEDQDQEAESPATTSPEAVQETVLVHFTNPTFEGHCHLRLPEARSEFATLTIRRPEPIEEDEELDVDQDLEDGPMAADQEPQEPTPWTQSSSTRYPSRFSPPTSPQSQFIPSQPSIRESMDHGHAIRRVDSDADDLTDEAVYHNRLLKEIFEEPMLKGELAAPSRRVQFPQEENDDEPETQRLEEEEPDQPSNQPTEIVASLENGAPLPSDQEAGLLRLLQDPKTPPNFLPFLNDVMKIHNLRKELQEKTSPQSDIPQSHTADGVSGMETERAAEEEAREEQERHHDQMAQAPASQVFQATTSQVFQAPASQVVQVPASQVSHVPIVQVSAQELIAQQMYLSQALQGTHPAARNEFDAAVQPALRAAYQQQQQQQHHHQEQQQKPRKRASGGEKKGSAPPPKTSRKNQQVPVQPPQMPQQMNYRPPNGYHGTFTSFALAPLAVLNRRSYLPQHFPFPQYQDHAQARTQAAQEAQARAQAQAAQEAQARAQAQAAQEAQARAQARAAQEAQARAQARAAQEAQARAQAQAAQEAQARAQARAQAEAQAYAQAQQRHAQNRARALVHPLAQDLPPHQIQPNAHAPTLQPIYTHPPPHHQNQVHVFPQPRIWARAAPHQQGVNDQDDVQFIGYQRAQNQLPPRPSNAPLLQHLLQTPHMQAVAQSEARTHAQVQARAQEIAAAQQRAQEATAAQQPAQEAVAAHQPAQDALAAHWQQLTQEQQNALRPIMNERTHDQLQDLLQRAAEYNAQLPQPQILPTPLAHDTFNRTPTSNRFFIIGYPSSSLACHFNILSIPLSLNPSHRPPTSNRSLTGYPLSSLASWLPILSFYRFHWLMTHFTDYRLQIASSSLAIHRLHWLPILSISIPSSVQQIHECRLPSSPKPPSSSVHTSTVAYNFLQKCHSSTYSPLLECSEKDTLF